MNGMIIPFEQEDPEFGELVASFIERLPFKGFKRRPRHPIYHIDKWSMTLNDPCVCGSGKKFKKCCIDT